MLNNSVYEANYINDNSAFSLSLNRLTGLQDAKVTPNRWFRHNNISKKNEAATIFEESSAK